MPTVADPALQPGTVAWAYLEPVLGREQGGRRPVLVVSTRRYLDVVETLAVVVPLTSTARGWPNHVHVQGVDGLDVCFAMTEQPRTLSRARLRGVIGVATPECLEEIRMWLTEFVCAE